MSQLSQSPESRPGVPALPNADLLKVLKPGDEVTVLQAGIWEILASCRGRVLKIDYQNQRIRLDIGVREEWFFPGFLSPLVQQKTPGQDEMVH